MPAVLLILNDLHVRIKHIFQWRPEDTEIAADQKASAPIESCPLFLFSAIKQSDFTTNPVSQQVTCKSGKRPVN